MSKKSKLTRDDLKEIYIEYDDTNMIKSPINVNGKDFSLPNPEPIVVDSTLSNTSTNPLQNKTITQSILMIQQNYAQKNRLVGFYDQPLYYDNMTNQKKGLPVITLNFSGSNTTTVTSSLITYLRTLTNPAEGYCVHLQITNAFVWQPSGTTIYARGFISIRSSDIDGNVFLKILHEPVITPQGEGGRSRLSQFELKIAANSTNAIQILETNEIILTYATDSISSDDYAPVKSSAVYSYLQGKIISNDGVVHMAYDLTTYQSLLSTYSYDYMRGLGKMFYFDLVNSKFYECIVQGTVTVDPDTGDFTPSPVVKYLNDGGVLITVDPTALSSTNFILYYGIAI